MVRPRSGTAMSARSDTSSQHPLGSLSAPGSGAATPRDSSERTPTTDDPGEDDFGDDGPARLPPIVGSYDSGSTMLRSGAESFKSAREHEHEHEHEHEGEGVHGQEHSHEQEQEAPKLSRLRSSSSASFFGGVRLPPARENDLEAHAGELAGTPAETPNASAIELPTTTLHILPASRSRSSSLSSIPSSLHLGGGDFRTRRPLLYTGIKAALLFVLCSLSLYLAVKAMLPPIEPEHKDAIKVPKSFEDLKRLNEVLQLYKDRNYFRVLGSFCLVYLFLQAFSIPGSMYLSILGGALFGVLVALPVVCVCVATGALMCYFISAALGPAILMASHKWHARLETWRERVRKQGGNLISYLIVLRIAPLPPHWMVNVIAPHLGITIWQFWLSTAVGIMGVTYIHTEIGTALDGMTSAEDFHLVSWRNFFGLAGIVAAVLVPVAIRRMWSTELEQAAVDVEAEEELLRSASSSGAATPTTTQPRSVRFDEEAGLRTKDYADDSDGESTASVVATRTRDKASRILGLTPAQASASQLPSSGRW